VEGPPAIDRRRPRVMAALGLGLALALATVYGIVQQCGGRIDVQSEVGKGSRFTVALPSATGAAERQHGAASETASLPSASALLAAPSPPQATRG
jgi:hypothetical protein